MSFGKANNRLRKMILFSLLQSIGLNVCFRCGELIHHVNDVSIDHKITWENSDNPVVLFFDLDNIAFSHLSCNAKAAKPRRRIPKCGTETCYKNGCRCDLCVDEHRTRHRIFMAQWREKKRIAGIAQG